ncbi:hypothetical protein D9M71_681900 [compost metagenome]
MRPLDQDRAALGDQHRQANQEQAVDPHRCHVLAPEQHQADLRQQAADNRQRPIQQQGHCGHADEVVGNAGVEIAPHQPERKQGEDRA